MAFLSSRGMVVFLGTTRSELVAAARAGAGADAFWPQAGRIAASTKTAARLKKAVPRDEPQKRRAMVSRLPAALVVRMERQVGGLPRSSTETPATIRLIEQ